VRTGPRLPHANRVGERKDGAARSDARDHPGIRRHAEAARLVGKGKGLELILSGELIDARGGPTGSAWSTASLPRVRRWPRRRNWRERYCRGTGPRSVSRSRRSMKVSRCRSRRGLFLEATLFGLVVTTEDFKEGTRAFLEKRKGRVQGSLTGICRRQSDGAQS